jgi:hypothetical protein
LIECVVGRWSLVVGVVQEGLEEFGDAARVHQTPIRPQPGLRN